MDKRLQDADVIIFDIGNVLINFDRQYIAEKMLPPSLVDYTDKPYFQKVWDQLDEGTLTSQQAASLFCDTYNITQSTQLFIQMMDEFHPFCQPLPLSNALKQLHNMGKKVYLLTNYGKTSFINSRHYFDFLQNVDGAVVSSFEKICKPHSALYQILLDRYAINPANTVYVDDRLENIEEGRKMGLTAIWYPSEYRESI